MILKFQKFADSRHVLVLFEPGNVKQFVICSRAGVKSVWMCAESWKVCMWLFEPGNVKQFVICSRAGVKFVRMCADSWHVLFGASV
jgi:hypothetical protein